MSKLWNVVEIALSDAARAEALMSDGGSRQMLRRDPELSLQMFELRAQEIRESIGIREGRAERRDLAVGNNRRQTAAGRRLPA
jgi:hypothetical protein